jgi:hypothetical protein
MTKKLLKAPKNPPLTKDDLKWFELSRYGKEQLDPLGLRGWLQVLANRLAIKSFLSSGYSAFALEAFRQLHTEPMEPLFGRVGSVPLSHPSDTPSVFFARAGTLRLYGGQAQALNLDISDSYDIQLFARESNQPRLFATVTVNLGATKSQIKKDFGKWLDEVGKLQAPPTNRVYTNEDKTFGEWIKCYYLPYFDLSLFAEIVGRSIPTELMVDTLQLRKLQKNENTDALDLLKPPRRSLTVFNVETLMAMWTQLGEHADPLDAAAG